jgi:hypothetical protein
MILNIATARRLELDLHGDWKRYNIFQLLASVECFFTAVCIARPLKEWLQLDFVFGQVSLVLVVLHLKLWALFSLLFCLAFVD